MDKHRWAPDGHGRSWVQEQWDIDTPAVVEQLAAQVTLGEGACSSPLCFVASAGSFLFRCVHREETVPLGAIFRLGADDAENRKQHHDSPPGEMDCPHVHCLMYIAQASAERIHARPPCAAGVAAKPRVRVWTICATTSGRKSETRNECGTQDGWSLY